MDQSLPDDVVGMLRGTAKIMTDVHRVLEEQVIMEPTRIGSIGIGTFLLLFFGILYILICCFGSLLKKPGFLYCWSTIFFAILVIFLFNATRSPMIAPASDVNDDKDQLYNVRIFLGILLSLCCCWSCCFYTQAHLARPFEVKGGQVEMGEQEPFVKRRAMF